MTCDRRNIYTCGAHTRRSSDAGRSPDSIHVVQPLISIITVVRNGEFFLERTIQSVIGQTYDAVELIIIDGGSTDGTLDIIRRYDPKIGYWSSEPDRGIYDAMNKGIDRATGDWICFMNAGDVFFDHDVLKNVVQVMPSDADVIYGNYEYNYGSGRRTVRRARKISDLWKGMVTSHQAMLVKSSLMKQYRFKTDSLIVADYELLYTLYQYHHRFYRLPIVFASVLADGFSASRNIHLTMDQWRIARRFSVWSPLLDLNYMTKLFGILFKNLLKTILPRRVVAYLRSR